jgi:hypothetical protein
MATKEWKQRTAKSTRLGPTYQNVTTFRLRGYLKDDFKGRQILTKLRIDDLDLVAASSKAKANTPASQRFLLIRPLNNCSAR